MPGDGLPHADDSVRENIHKVTSSRSSPFTRIDEQERVSLSLTKTVWLLRATDFAGCRPGPHQGDSAVKIRDLLQAKGEEVHSIHPSATLADVVTKLVECNCGSLMVMDDDRIAGIITERDILRASAGDSRPLAEVLVAEKMSTQLVTAAPEDDVAVVMGLLTRHRIRHLPIVVREQLAGIISIGDVVKAQFDHLSMENEYLRNYIQG